MYCGLDLQMCMYMHIHVHMQVTHIVVVGAVKRDAVTGELLYDGDNTNNALDTKSASFVYGSLLSDDRFWFIVVSRYAVSECQLPRGAFDGSAHPLARRLTEVQKPALADLWRRVHQTEVERIITKDTLPMSRNAAWFRNTFLEPNAPASLSEGCPYPCPTNAHALR